MLNSIVELTILIYKFSVDRHLGCIYFLANVEKAAMKIQAQFFWWTHVIISLALILRNDITRSMVGVVLTLYETIYSFDKSAILHSSRCK